MVELFEQDCKTNDRQSSKGNQLKWENNGVWYKADYCGYEGLAEYVISNLLRKSSLKDEQCVLYDLEQIMYKTVCYNGVKSHNFLHDDWQIITLERLYKNFTGMSLYEQTWRILGAEERLVFLVTQVVKSSFIIPDISLFRTSRLVWNSKFNLLRINQGIKYFIPKVIS